MRQRTGIGRDTTKSSSRKSQIDFYENIGPDRYLTEVRRFVPVYDDIVKVVVATLVGYKPTIMLDIGSGIGNVDEELLERLGASSITCVDASKRMVSESKTRLRGFGDRATVVCCPIEKFGLSGEYDAIFSILTLHNLSPEIKSGVLNKISKYLSIGAPFIWADLIRHADPKIHEQLMEIRRKYAEQHGASAEFIEENFRKENERDSKFTISETLQLCAQVGFENADVIWTGGTASIFVMVKR